MQNDNKVKMLRNYMIGKILNYKEKLLVKVPLVK